MKLIATIEGLTLTVANEAQGVAQVLVLDARNPAKTWGNDFGFVLSHLPYIWYQIKNLTGAPSNDLVGFWVLNKQDLRIAPGDSINPARRSNNLKVLHDDSPGFDENWNVLRHHRLSFDRVLGVEDRDLNPATVLEDYLKRDLESEHQARLIGRVILTDGVLEGETVRKALKRLPLIGFRKEATPEPERERTVAPMARLVLDFGPGVDAVTLWSTSFTDETAKNQLTLRPAEGENEVFIRIGNVEIDELDRTLSEGLPFVEHNERDRDFRLLSEVTSNTDVLANRWWPIQKRRSGRDVGAVPGCIKGKAYTAFGMYNGTI